MKQLTLIGLLCLPLALLAAQCGAPAPETTSKEQPAAETSGEEPAAEEAAPAAEEEPASEPEAAATEAEEPAASSTETTLVVAVPDDIQTLDHCCANFIRANQAIYHLYEVPVIHHAKQLENEAWVGDTSQLDGLAFESWERLENGTDIKVKIREGMKFLNGKEITAEDVAYMLERSLNTKGDSPEKR